MTQTGGIEIVYSQYFPRGRRPYEGIPGTADNAEYVYILRDKDFAPVYVGRSWRPTDRFSKHRRKSWWGQVNHLTIMRVRGVSRLDTEVRTAQVEKACIEELKPSANIAGGSRRWAWHGKN